MDLVWWQFWHALLHIDMPCQDEMLSMQLNALKHEAQVTVEAGIVFEQNLICVCVLEGCWMCSMFNVVSCGMMSDAWTILERYLMIDTMTQWRMLVQVSPFLISSPDFWPCSVALCLSMLQPLQQYFCAVTPQHIALNPRSTSSTRS